MNYRDSKWQVGGHTPLRAPRKHRQAGRLVATGSSAVCTVSSFVPPLLHPVTTSREEIQTCTGAPGFISLKVSVLVSVRALSAQLTSCLLPPCPQLIDHWLPQCSGAICLQLRGNGFLANRAGKECVLCGRPACSQWLKWAIPPPDRR